MWPLEKFLLHADDDLALDGEKTRHLFRTLHHVNRVEPEEEELWSAHLN